MLYKKQELSAGMGLTWQFDSITNFKITKPIWKDKFWPEFHLTVRDWLESAWVTSNILSAVTSNNKTYLLAGTSDTTISIVNNDNVIWSGVRWQSERLLKLKGGTSFDKTANIIAIWEGDPTAKEPSDVFEQGYIKITLDETVLPWQYITFTSGEKNLQSITSRVHYVEWGIAYIRGTNFYGTLPNTWWTVDINNTIWDVLVVAEKYSVSVITERGTSIMLYECADLNDEIIDIEVYNNVLFILTKQFVFFSRRLINTNTNIYPLDFFDNMFNWIRLVAFWKMLLLFGDDWWQVITPISGTSWSVGYVTVDLNYNNRLWSKYSILADKWSLYIVQEDKTFVKVNVLSNDETTYDVVTEDLLKSVQWMLDEIEWPVYMSKSDRYINIINPNLDNNNTYSYNYNILYNYWNEWTYDNTLIRSLWDIKYGETLFKITEEPVSVNQKIKFTLGETDLDVMKTCFFVKFILVCEQNRVPDYELTITKYLAWFKTTTVVDLKDYPINEHLYLSNNNLGDWDYDLSIPHHKRLTNSNLGYIITPVITLNDTWDLFEFTLRNKVSGQDNIITYWGSIIWYRKHLPESTGYSYNITTK